MSLEDILFEEKELGNLKDLENDNEYSLEIKRQNRRRCGMNLLEISIKEDSKKIGRIMFYADFDGDRMIYGGMETYKNSRNKSISNALLETLFQYAESLEYKIISTTPQRKPMNIFVLTKYGFTPKYKSDRRKVIIFPAKKSDMNPKLRIGFENNNTESNFKRSVLYRSNQYEIVKDIKEQPIGEIMLHTPYSLHNYIRFQEKREQNKKRYKIKFLEAA